MKKVLSLVLIVIMCLFTLTSCDMSDVKTWIGTNMPWVGTIIPGLTPDQPDEPDEPSNPTTVADNARDYLESIYISFLDNNKTPADFELISSFKFNGSTATVAWTTNNESITFVPKEGKEDTVVIATLPARGEADVEYVLTGTVTAPDGSTATLSYTLVIPQMAINTYAEYVAAAEDDLITVEGIVTGITKKSDGWSANNLFLQDADGGYYVYNLADDQLNGVEVGMKVRVSGSKDNYNGTYEVVSASVSIVDSNKAPVSPADYTELLKNAEGLEADALVSKQAFLVTIKGVTILEAGENGYYYFQLGEHKVYLRISSSNNPCTSADVDAIKAAHAANFGNTGDVTGLVSIYSNKFYLTPVSGEAFNNFTVVEKTPAEKVATEKENFSINTSYNASGNYTLPLTGANYSDVAVSWASDSEYVVIGDNGAITVNVPDTKTVVKLTATFTCGESTDTKEFEVTLNKTVISVSDALEIAKAQDSNGYTQDKYLVGGIITSIKSDVFGNMTISDGVNELYVYGVYSSDGVDKFEKLESKPAVGDYIVLLGVLGQYNGSTQLKSGWLVSFASPTSIPDANTAAEAAGSSYSNDKYLISGTVSSIVSTQYGNMYIKDADGNEFYVYGLYDLAGTRYDSLTTKPEVGDVVVLYGILGQYTNKSNVTTNQMKNATLVSLVKGEKEPEIPTEEGKVTLYFTLKSDSAEIPSYAVPYITGGAWGTDGWADWCVKGAQKFTHLEGTDIWYVITDNDLTKDDEYKILLNVSLSNGHGWKNPSVVHVDGANAKYVYEAGQKLVDLGEHGFANINIANPSTATWVVVGSFNGWDNSKGLALASVGNGVFESDYFEITESKEFKITNGNWISNDGGIEIADPTTADNFKIETAGKYKVSFNVNTGAVTVVAYSEGGETPDPDPDPDTPVTDSVVFDDFGGKFDNKHSDGATENGKTPKDGDTLTSGDATLVINNPYKMYLQAFNESGDSCIKMGAGSEAGTFSFTVGSDVKSVKIYISGYKKTDAKVKVNDTEYTAKALYNEYDTSVEVNDWTVIVVDTSTNKTVTITTLKGGYRCMIDKIELVK